MKEPCSIMATWYMNPAVPHKPSSPTPTNKNIRRFKHLFRKISLSEYFQINHSHTRQSEVSPRNGSSLRSWRYNPDIMLLALGTGVVSAGIADVCVEIVWEAAAALAACPATVFVHCCGGVLSIGACCYCAARNTWWDFEVALEIVKKRDWERERGGGRVFL